MIGQNQFRSLPSPPVSPNDSATNILMRNNQISPDAQILGADSKYVKEKMTKQQQNYYSNYRSYQQRSRQKESRIGSFQSMYDPTPTPSLHDDSLLKTLAQINYAGNFAFQQRRGSINWHAIYQIDLDKIVREVDIHTLEGLKHNIALSYFDTTDIEKFNQIAFVKLFRLSQLMIQYLIWIQDYLQVMVKTEDNQCKILHQQLHQAYKELKTKQKIIQTYEYMIKSPLDTSFKIYKCRQCSKKFVSLEYLQSHLRKIHNASSSSVLQNYSNQQCSFDLSQQGIREMEKDMIRQQQFDTTSAGRIQEMFASYQEQSKQTVEKLDALYDHFNQEISLIKSQKNTLQQPGEEIQFQNQQQSKVRLKQQHHNQQQSYNEEYDQRSDLRDQSRANKNGRQASSSNSMMMKNSYINSTSATTTAATNPINVNVDLKSCFQELREMFRQMQASQNQHIREQTQEAVAKRLEQEKKINKLISQKIEQLFNRQQSKRRNGAQNFKQFKCSVQQLEFSEQIIKQLSKARQLQSQQHSTTRQLQQQFNVNDPHSIFALNLSNTENRLTQQMNTPDSKDFGGTAEFNRIFNTSKNDSIGKQIESPQMSEKFSSNHNSNIKVFTNQQSTPDKKKQTKTEEVKNQNSIIKIMNIIDNELDSDEEEEEEKEFKSELRKSEQMGLQSFQDSQNISNISKAQLKLTKGQNIGGFNTLPNDDHIV